MWQGNINMVEISGIPEKKIIFQNHFLTEYERSATLELQSVKASDEKDVEKDENGLHQMKYYV